MSCDCEKLRVLLIKTAHELDGAWLGEDSQFRTSSSPPDAERASLVAEIESVVAYEFTTRD